MKEWFCQNFLQLVAAIMATLSFIAIVIKAIRSHIEKNKQFSLKINNTVKRKYYSTDKKFHNKTTSLDNVKMIRVFIQLIIKNNSSRPIMINECCLWTQDANTEKTINYYPLYQDNYSSYEVENLDHKLNRLKIDCIEPFGSVIINCYFDWHDIDTEYINFNLYFHYKNENMVTMTSAVDKQLAKMIFSNSITPRSVLAT